MKFKATLNFKSAEWDDAKLNYVGDKEIIKTIRAIESTCILCGDSFANVKVMLESMNYIVEYEPDTIPDDVIQ
jgi:hypothetical protein